MLFPESFSFLCNLYVSLFFALGWGILYKPDTEPSPAAHSFPSHLSPAEDSCPRNSHTLGFPLVKGKLWEGDRKLPSWRKISNKLPHQYGRKQRLREKIWVLVPRKYPLNPHKWTLIPACSHRPLPFPADNHSWCHKPAAPVLVVIAKRCASNS